MKKSGDFKNEYNKIKRCFVGTDEKLLETIEPLIELAAFNYSQMQRLMIDIEKDGPLSLFKQGKQEYMRKHPAFDMYTKLNSQYLAMMKELIKLLPEKSEAANELESFLGGAKLKAVK